MTPQQVADLAKSVGLDGLAITDHDECRGFGELMRSGMMLIPASRLRRWKATARCMCWGLTSTAAARASTAMCAAPWRSAAARRVIADKLQAAGYNVTLEDIEQECRKAMRVDGRMSRWH